MELTFEPRRGRPIGVLALAGRVDFSAAGTLREALGHLVRDGWHHLVLDLSAVTLLDSTALGALVSGLKAARNAGGDLRVAGLSDAVHARLRSSRLDRILVPHATVAEALAELEGLPGVEPVW